MLPISIVSASSYCREALGELPPLKALAREAIGRSVRRIGRFVELALVGAGRCVGGRTLPAETATYFTSTRGDLEVTLDVLVQMCEHGRLPAPFTFINTVGNTACFHVADSFGLSGPSQFVTSRYAPLEAALRLAALDLSEGRVTMALVGSTDVCTLPLAAHRERIGLSADTPVGEASHWFLLATGDSAGTPLGALRSVRSFPDAESLRVHLFQHPINFDRAALASGQHLTAERLKLFREATGNGPVFDYRSGLPFYDSQTGYGVHRFLTEPVARTLVHIEGDPSGRCTLLVVDAGNVGSGTGTGPVPDPNDPIPPRDSTRSPRDRRNV